jgi:hypothetical protein
VANLPSQIVGLNLFFLRGTYLTLKYTVTSFKFYETPTADYFWNKSPELFSLIDEKNRWGTIGIGLLRQLNNKTFIYFGPGLVFHSKCRYYCLDTGTLYKNFRLVSTVNLYKPQIKNFISINLNSGFLLSLTTEVPQSTGVYLIVGGNSNPLGVEVGLGLNFK